MNNIAAMMLTDVSEKGCLLSDEGKRRYYELAWLSGYMGDELARDLDRELFKLEAFAGPIETSTKIKMAYEGYNYQQEESR